MKVTNDTVDAWFFVLCDEDAIGILSAARTLGKTRHESSFMPSPSVLINLALEISSGFSAAEDVWSRGPSASKSEFEKLVWKRWGGDVRFNSLPDVTYSEDSLRAQSALSFARKEFIDLYNALRREKAVSNAGHLSLPVEALGILRSCGLLPSEAKVLSEG